MRNTIHVITTNVFNKVEYECPIKEARFVKTNGDPIPYGVFEAAPDIAKSAEALLEVIGHVVGIESQRKALISALRKGLDS